MMSALTYNARSSRIRQLGKLLQVYQATPQHCGHKTRIRLELRNTRMRALNESWAAARALFELAVKSGKEVANRTKDPFRADEDPEHLAKLKDEENRILRTIEEQSATVELQTE